MKAKLFVLFVVFFTNCTHHDRETIKQQIDDDKSVVLQNIFYIQDNSTNLCYAVLKSTTYAGRDVYSITCVSCDSIKRINLLK